MDKLLADSRGKELKFVIFEKRKLLVLKSGIALAIGEVFFPEGKKGYIKELSNIDESREDDGARIPNLDPEVLPKEIKAIVVAQYGYVTEVQLIVGVIFTSFRRGQLFDLSSQLSISIFIDSFPTD